MAIKNICTKRKQAVFNGFKAWAKDEYTVFGDQKLRVEINIKETLSPYSIQIKLIDKSEILNLLPFGLNSLNTSMAWGGKGIYDWSPDSTKFMILRDDKESTAKHEFGHILGLGDAYGGSVFGNGVETSLYDDLTKSAEKGNYSANDFVMNNNTNITNNDIEMVILAFSTGKRQNYQKQFPWSNVSGALGKGN